MFFKKNRLLKSFFETNMKATKNSPLCDCGQTNYKAHCGGIESLHKRDDEAIDPHSTLNILYNVIVKLLSVLQIVFISLSTLVLVNYLYSVNLCLIGFVFHQYNYTICNNKKKH